MILLLQLSVFVYATIFINDIFYLIRIENSCDIQSTTIKDIT